MTNLIQLAERLRAANMAHAARQPDAVPQRQPVHTVYGGAHLFHADVARRMGQRALAAMDDHPLDAAALGRMVGVDQAVAERVLEQVRRKLATEPVEDYRIDFEDGYGVRPDAEEDGHAAAAADAVAQGARSGSLPPGIGIRVKALAEETRVRSERTLRAFLDRLLVAGAPPEGFLVSLPKVTLAEQPAYLAALLGDAETRHGLPPRTLRMEIMVEAPDALFGADGRAALPGLVAAGEGRVIAAHLGAYDYTALLGVTAAEQRLRHPACDWARSAMQVQLAGSGVAWVDGATTRLPVPVHRGETPTDRQREENRAAMESAWRLHAEDVRHGLASGYYQGWDLHPAQLVSRYAAVYAFFLESFAPAAARLRNFLDRAAQATRVGTAFDDAATGQGLLNYFRRGLSCGALTAPEVEEALGIPAASLAARHFADLVGPT